MGTICVRFLVGKLAYTAYMYQAPYWIVLSCFLLCACHSIPQGRDPLFARGEMVVEVLSGRVGIIEDGHYSAFQRSWRYRVRFVPSSRFTSYGYSSSPGARTGSASNRGVVWLYSYELMPAKQPSEPTPGGK